VYIHKGRDNNEVFYVGIGKPSRAYDNGGRNKYWYEYVRKHGKVVEVTHSDIILEEASVIEKYLIAFYGRRDLGVGALVNLTDGGSGFENMSLISRKKISESKTGKPRPDLSERNRALGGVPRPNRRGINHHGYGKPVSKETRDKISKGLNGKMSGESHPMYGIRGTEHHFYGKKHTEETRRKISKRNKGKLSGGLNPRAKKICDQFGNIVFNSGKELSDTLGVPFSTVRCWLNKSNTPPEWFKYNYAA